MLFFVLLLSFFGVVQADGKLEIELVKYKHSASKDFKGSCCDSYVRFDCSNDCDNYFIICYRDYDPRTRRVSDCVETRKTGIFGDRFTFKVGKDLLGNSLDNPFKINFNGAWDNSFSLKIDILDRDRFNRDDLVDVLTANFANAAISSAWTSLTMKGKFSKRLVLKWRVQCRPNFYGDCSVLCVPHDSDSDGHYSCDRTTGERICTKGWTGNKCITPVCANCSRHGRCVKPNECQCTSGWTGKSCEKCVPNQSCVNGFCVRGNDCVCYSPWIGQHCDRQQTGCNEFFCLNGGTCVVHRDNVRCSCLSDYNGTNCAIDVNQCRSDPCLHGGTCRSLPNDYLCLCPSGYSGKTCSQDIDECLINACLYGNCTDSINDFFCTCHPGFTGPHCATDVDECASDVNNCGSGMSCENTFGGHTCKCKLGYEETPDGLSCKPIQCDALSYLSNTTTSVQFSSENRQVNSTANITCLKGFFMNQTTPLRLLCLGDGLWDGDPEACEDIDECLVSSCLSDEVCYNTRGSYECRSRERSGVNSTISPSTISPCSPGNCNQSNDHLNDDHVFDTSHGGSQSAGLYVGIALGLLVCFAIIVAAVIAFRRQVKLRSSEVFASAASAASPVPDTVGGSSTSTSVCLKLATETDNAVTAVKRDAEPTYEVIPSDANQYEDMTGLSKSKSKSRSADNPTYASLNIQNAEGELAAERSVNKRNPIYGLNTQDFRTFEMKKIVS